MLKQQFFALVLLLLPLMAVSCGEDNKPEIKGVHQISNLDATAYDSWTYFSFEKGGVVAISDPENSMAWDVAFHRQHIRVNAPFGYKGKGGLFVSDATGIDQEITPKEYLGNSQGNLPVKVNMGPDRKEDDPMYLYEKQYYVNNSAGNPMKNTAVTYTVNMAAHGEGGTPDPSKMYQPNPKILLIKNAKGDKHYKLRVIRAVNDKGQKGGTLSFEYQQL